MKKQARVQLDAVHGFQTAASSVNDFAARFDQGLQRLESLTQYIKEQIEKARNTPERASFRFLGSDSRVSRAHALPGPPSACLSNRKMGSTSSCTGARCAWTLAVSEVRSRETPGHRIPDSLLCP